MLYIQLEVKEEGKSDVQFRCYMKSHEEDKRLKDWFLEVAYGEEELVTYEVTCDSKLETEKNIVW